MKYKLISIICILSILCTLLSGCYDARGVEDLSYATAIGLDTSDNNIINLTIQFSIPNSSSGSGSSQGSTTNVITVGCSSIDSGISLINSYISREVNLAHCKVIVLSEELAAKGISEYINTLSNNLEIRPDCNIIISRCTAKYFIENANPSIETLTARYYEVTFSSNKYTGYTTNTKLVELVGSIQSNSEQATAILGSVINLNNDSTEQNNSNASDSSAIAGEIPIDDKNKIQVYGTAVFNDDKLVGELNGMETICHLLVNNNFESFTLSIPNPFTINSTMDLRVKKRQTTNINLDFVNGTPYISINVYLDGFGLSLDDNIAYDSIEDINLINTYAEEYLKLELNNYLYKTSKILNSDIDGFGKYALSKYLTIDEWTASNWLENYKYSFFDVNVDINIKSGYQFDKAI